MKKIYWRPREFSRAVLVLVAAFSIGGIVAVEGFTLRVQQPYYEEKYRAATLAREAMEVIRREKLARGLEIDPAADPAGSGMIGTAISPVTSDPGSLASKRTSINPNFAAVVVEWLRLAGLKKGDVVAIGMSGSFPAINISVYAALHTLELTAIPISSAASSQWGANHPDFLWLDMERILAEEGIFRFRSVAASLGGVEDRALGMAEEGRRLLREGIERNGLPFIASPDFQSSIEQRMRIYAEKAGPRPIRAYINVGGGTTSVGTRVGKRMFEPGLNLTPPPGSRSVDSVMNRFINNGVPVIHLIQIEDLATEYGLLPLQPKVMPQVGEGKIFVRREYNRYLAAVVLVAILAGLYAFIRSEWGFRLLHSSGRRPSDALEPMI